MILKTLFFHPLGPALILSLGGGLLAVLRRMALRRAILAEMIAGRPLVGLPKSRLLDVRLPLALLAILGATALLVHLRSLSPQPILAWTWQPLTVAGSVLEWRLDAWNWIASAVIIALAGIALLLGEGLFEPASPTRLDLAGVDGERTLWLAAAALVFVSSGNILTLASSWLVLDAALAVRLHLGPTAGATGRVWGALSLAGILLLCLLALLGETGIRTSLTGGRLTEGQIVLLWLAALIRAGVYPFHFWLTGLGDARRDRWLPMVLLGPTAGLWLLGRVHALAGQDWLRRPEWIALSALALLGTALVAWTVEDPNRRWRWIALNRASLAVMAAYTASAVGPEALVWSLVTFGLGCALLAAGQAARRMLGWRGPLWLAGLALWGLPGTVGFLARSVLVFPTESPLAVPLFAVVLLAEVLLVAGLWEAVHYDVAPPPAGERPDRLSALRVAAAVILLAVPLIAFGLFPRVLAGLAGWPDAKNLGSLFSSALGATRRSVWGGLAFSAVLGVALGIRRESILGQMRGWQAGIAGIASLEWLYKGAAAGFAFLAGGLQYFATLGEGEGYLGWLALAGLILWVLLRG